jgi:hypothetical protein
VVYSDIQRSIGVKAKPKGNENVCKKKQGKPIRYHPKDGGVRVILLIVLWVEDLAKSEGSLVMRGIVILLTTRKSADLHMW